MRRQADLPGEPLPAEAGGRGNRTPEKPERIPFYCHKRRTGGWTPVYTGGFAGGALGVVCERLPEQPAGPCILVEDSLSLKRIGEFYRRQLSVKVVGITGSVGKTSTKEFVLPYSRRNTGSIRPWEIIIMKSVCR